VAAEVLEHLRDPAALVDETRRVLRPGGIFAGSVPNAYRLKNRLRFLAGRPAERNPTHLHLFTPGELLELLDGFSARLDYVVGRFVRFHPRLLANVIVFRGQTSL
jgi:SAM-dependent methyltransferase